MASSAARSLLRSSSPLLRGATASSAAARPGVAAAAARPPLRRLPGRRPSSLSPSLRSPMMMLSFCAESLLPEHSARSDALMTSLLSVSRRSYSYMLEDTLATRSRTSYCSRRIS